MMDDIRLGFKLMKYSHGRKMLIFSGFALLVVGIAFTILGTRERTTIGGYFFACAAMYAMQLLFSVEIAGLATSSPLKKRVQTRVAACINGACMLAAYGLYVILSFVLAMLMPERIGLIRSNLLCSILFFAMLILYTATVFKSYVISTILFVGVMIPLLFILVRKQFSISIVGEGLGGLALEMLFGAVVIILMNIVAYFIMKLFYKLPISMKSQAVTLRKSM